MFRWIAVCTLLAVGTFGLFYYVAQYTGLEVPPNAPSLPPSVTGFVATFQASAPESKPDPEPREEPRASAAQPEVRPVEIHQARAGSDAVQDLVIQAARVLPARRQEVPTELDGKLLFIATDLKPEEAKLIADLKRQGQPLPDWYTTAEMGFLAVAVAPGEQVPPEQQIYFPGNRQMYRRYRPDDKLEPGKTVVGRQVKELCRLEVGMRVEEGQLLALVNPALDLEDLAIKNAKLEAAEADRQASVKTKEEAEKRYDAMTKSRLISSHAVSDDDYRGAKLTWDRYKYEEVAKEAAVRQAQRELSGAATKLGMHEVRSYGPGVVKVLYKNPGDSVKNLEPILEIQNPRLLWVQGLADVQDARFLKQEMEQASARKQDVLVTVEATQPEPPRAILSGHRNEVTCVAVSKGSRPVIVSGSEDHTVRIWGRPDGQERWVERWVLDLQAVVRAVACTPPKAKKNLLLTGTADGVVRLFDLDNLKARERRLEARHAGAVTCVAFSPDGEWFATGGEDRTICLWRTADGARVYRITGAHRQPVTSLQFTLNGLLVSAGRDGWLNLWNVKGGQAPVQLPGFDRRSGNVDQLGVSPDGTRVLFDQGRELQVLSLDSHRIEGVLRNPSGATNFTTMALFAPDGKTILTNGAGPGRLQLWRAPEGPDRRAGELRQFLWTSGAATCGAFAPEAEERFAVTGTQDHQVLVWAMPGEKEVSKRLTARLSYVEEFLDTSLNKVPIRDELVNPGYLLPGGTATMVIRPNQVSH
jgi:WD40 repeat protein